MPPIKFTAFKRYAYIVKTIVLLNKIMPSRFNYIEKKLLYIAIIALFSCQPSSYFKYTKLNIYLFYNIRLVSNAKYTCLIYLYSLRSL